MTEHLSWRAVFAVNLPLGVIAAVLALRVPQAPISRGSAFRPDVVGALLFSLSTLSLADNLLQSSVLRGAARQ